MTLQRAICKSIRPYAWHSLLASLPLSVIVAIGWFGVGKSTPNDVAIAKMTFKVKESFVNLIKFSLRKDVFQLP